MSDEWKYKELPRASGKIAPAQWNPETGEWEVFTGLGKVEVTNQIEMPADYPDAAVKAELQAIKDDNAIIKQTQADILAKLNDTIDTRLTGSNMEYYGKSTDTKPADNIIKGATFFEIDTTKVFMWDGTEWVEGGIKPEPQQQEPTLEERLEALESLELERMFGND